MKISIICALHLIFQTDKIKKSKDVGQLKCMGGNNSCKGLQVQIPYGKGSVGRSGHRLENNV